MIIQILGGIYNFVYYPLLLLAVILIIIGLLLYFKQNKMLYIPQMGDQLSKSPSNNPYLYQQPSRQNLSHKNIQIRTQDGQLLKGWPILTQNPTKNRTIIYFHQNAGNIGTRIPYLNEYYNRTNSNILLVAYRGYSDSSGTPSQQGIKKDGLAILKFILSNSQIDNKKIYLHGRSLGGAVAAYVAAHKDYNRQIRGLILQNTFTCIADMVDKLFSFISFLKPLIQRNYWQTFKQIPKIKIPILFIKSGRDELVPLSQMQKLCEIAKSNNLVSKQHYIKYGTHNETYSINPQQYFKTIKSFFLQQCQQI